MSTIAPPAPAGKPRPDVARIDSRVRRTVGNRNGPGAIGSLLVLALVIASVWYLWQGVRGFWTHGQEGTVSAIQVAIGVFAFVLAFAEIVYAGWAFWTVAAVLLGIAGYAFNAMFHDPHVATRAWIAIGLSLFLLYDHLSNRARFGHGTEIKPFESAPPVEPGITEMLTGAARRENLVIALNNAIADAGRIRDLPEDALATVAAAGGSSLDRELKGDAAWLYRSYVAHFTAGGVVAPDAPGELEHLAVLLRLPEETVKRAHRDIGGELYKARMEEAARDRVLAPDEAEGLAQIHSQLDLPDEEVEKIRASAQGDVLRRVYGEVLHGGRIDAEGEAKLIDAMRQMDAAKVDPALARDIFTARVRDTFGDGILREDEAQALAHLEGLLGISDADAAAIRQRHADEALRRVYGEVLHGGRIDAGGEARLREAMARIDVAALDPGVRRDIYRGRVRGLFDDREVDDADAETLASLQAALALSDAAAVAIRKECASPVVERAVDAATEDDQLDDEEARELEALAARLGFDLRADEATRDTLDRARALWEIEHGRLPVVRTDVGLEAGEVCHAERRAVLKEWAEIDYGTTYVAESKVRDVGIFIERKEVVTKVREYHDVRDELLSIDTGRILVTSRGLVFHGDKLRLSWPWSRLDVSFDRKYLVARPSGDDKKLFQVKGEMDLLRKIVDRASAA
jgi:hypothetical protein